MLPHSDQPTGHEAGASPGQMVPCITQMETAVLERLAAMSDLNAPPVVLEPWVAKLEQLVDAVVIHEAARYTITHWSDGAVLLFGWSREEMLGRGPDEISFRARTAQMAMEEEIAKYGEWTSETAFVGKDGRSLVVNERAILLRCEQGQPRSVIVAATDVTEKRRAETELLRMQRLDSVGALVAGLAHDFNNVLAPILMCSPVLAAGGLEPEVSRVVAETILGSARHGSAIVRQVLNFARGAERRRLPLEVGRVLHEVVGIATQIFPKNIQIVDQYGPDLWLSAGDPNQIHQVLLNLMINARDAMPQGGLLTLKAANFVVDEEFASMIPDARVGPYLMLAVADTGTGISRSILSRLFEPFFTTKEPGAGTGLGLSTALNVVKDHGGFITVESELGCGSTFKVYLPAEGVGREELPPEFRNGPRGAGETILLADGDARIRTVGRLILELAGYAVLDAADGTEILALYAQNRERVAAVVCDLRLAFLEGMALVRALLTLDPAIKLLPISAGADLPVRELSTLGVKTFLTKPFDGYQLLEALHGVIHPPLEAIS